MMTPRLGSGFAVVSGRWDRGAGFWTSPPGQRVAASVRARYESWSAGLRAVAPLTSEIELQARALLFDDHRTLRFAGADSTSSGGDASLRPIAGGPFAERRRGDNGHRKRREFQRREKPRQSGADDHDIKGALHDPPLRSRSASLNSRTAMVSM